MHHFSKIGIATLLLPGGIYVSTSSMARAGVNFSYASQIVGSESTSGGYSATGWAGQLNSNAGYAFVQPSNSQTGSGHYYLTPFEPAWTTPSSAASYGGPVGLAQINPGATLVLQFPTSSGFVASTSSTVNNGFTIGIHAGVGITDTSPGATSSSTSYSGTGVAGNPATTFNKRVSYLAVGNGTNWVWFAGQTLNSSGTSVISTQWTAPANAVPTASSVPTGAAQMTFNNPSAYYASTAVSPDGGYNTITPPTGTPLADPSKDFTGTLSAFNGQDYSQIMTTLAGSAGGDWLNLADTGLNQVTQIAFVVPASGSSMDVQAVVGVDTPEPAGLSLLALGGLALLLRRRFRPAIDLRKK